MEGRSDLGTGVKIMTMGGKMMDVRRRCLGMTDMERRWRAQFLKDQILAHDEPRNVPELYKDTTNIIRRLWRTPLWNLQKAATPILGKRMAGHVRHVVGKGIGFIISVYVLTYLAKYHANDWTNADSFVLFKCRDRVYKNDPDFPHFKEKTAQDYYDMGFYSSPYARKIEPESLTSDVQPPKVLRDGVEFACPTH